MRALCCASKRVGAAQFEAAIRSEALRATVLRVLDRADASAPELDYQGVYRIDPGSGAVQILELTSVGSKVFFFADDGVVGLEPWVLDLNGGAIPFTSTYGRGCRGTDNAIPAIGARGLPALGNGNFAATVGNGAPVSQALLNVGIAPTQIAIGGCRVLVAPPQIDAGIALLDANGQGSAGLPVPANPALLGAQLFAQWIVLDPNGQLLGIASLSDGLRIQIGQ